MHVQPGIGLQVQKGVGVQVKTRSRITGTEISWWTGTGAGVQIYVGQIIDRSWERSTNEMKTDIGVSSEGAIESRQKEEDGIK